MIDLMGPEMIRFSGISIDLWCMFLSLGRPLKPTLTPWMAGHNVS